VREWIHLMSSASRSHWVIVNIESPSNPPPSSTTPSTSGIPPAYTGRFYVTTALRLQRNHGHAKKKYAVNRCVRGRGVPAFASRKPGNQTIQDQSHFAEQPRIVPLLRSTRARSRMGGRDFYNDSKCEIRRTRTTTQRPRAKKSSE